MTLEDFDRWFSSSDGRTPFGKQNGPGALAFIIFPNQDLQSLTAYDCYRDGTKESDIIKTFVNTDGLPMKGNMRQTVSSILFGVPSSFINGIAINDDLISLDNIIFLIQEFPGVFITNSNGKIIYKPEDSLEQTKENIEKIKNIVESSARKI